MNNPTGKYDHYTGTVPLRSKIQNNDLILSWSATLKAVIWKHGDGVLNQHLFKVEPCPRISILYLSYTLKHNIEKIGSNSHGSTMQHITRSILKRYNIIFPQSVNEQNNIADILTTIDNLIDHTESLIAKYQAIKQGMMHDLFTRGVDANGRLRPPREEAPELYKESELGWIPKEWEVTRAEEVCLAVIDCKNRTPPEAEDGYPVIKTSNIKNGKLQLSNITMTDEISYSLWTLKGKPSDGDVLITREAPIGEACIVPDNMQVCLGQRMMMYRPNSDFLESTFLLYLILSNPIQKRLIELAGGSTVGHVRVSDIRSLLILLAPKHEQMAISEKLSNVDSYINIEQKCVLKLYQVKSGLMHDLLTGTVRTPPHLTPAQEPPHAV